MSQTTSLIAAYLALALMNLLDPQILNTTALLNVHLPFANNVYSPQQQAYTLLATTPLLRTLCITVRTA
jgi:hypothetical protein